MAKLLDIPEEVLDMVLEQLACGEWQDASAKMLLKRCSLVCKPWCRLSRRLLFRAITIHTTFDKRIKFIADDPDILVHTPDQLLQFLTTHRHIACHIKELSWVNEIDPSETPYPRALFLDVLLHLPSIKVLDVADLFLEAASLAPDPPTLHLERLVVQTPQTTNEAGHLDVIGLFRSLGVLELLDMELDPSVDSPRLSTSVQPHTLILRDIPYVPRFLTALESAGITNRVSSVCLDNIKSLRELQAVSRFLAAVDENLVRLELDFHLAMVGNDEIDLDSVLRLRRSKKLHTLVLKNLQTPRLPCPTFWRRLKQFLTLCQENASTLHNVEIEFTGYLMYPVDDFRALKACLLEALDSSRTSQIVTVRQFPLPGGASEIAGLSHLCDMGILRFEEE